MSRSTKELEPLSTDLMLKTITALIRTVFKEPSPTVRISFIGPEWHVVYESPHTTIVTKTIDNTGRICTQRVKIVSGSDRLLYNALRAILDQLVSAAFTDQT